MSHMPCVGYALRAAQAEKQQEVVNPIVNWAKAPTTRKSRAHSKGLKTQGD